VNLVLAPSIHQKMSASLQKRKAAPWVNGQCVPIEQQPRRRVGIFGN
jgi:hypothetical protein